MIKGLTFQEFLSYQKKQIGKIFKTVLVISEGFLTHVLIFKSLVTIHEKFLQNEFRNVSTTIFN